MASSRACSRARTSISICPRGLFPRTGHRPASVSCWLPIGGLKEKLLAALRGGITTVLIPQENEKDLEDIPADIRDGLKIVPVRHVDEVLQLALVQPTTAIDWSEADDLAAQHGPAIAPPAGDLGEAAIRH